MNIINIQTPIPFIDNLDLSITKVILIDYIRPIVEREYKGIKDLRIRSISGVSGPGVDKDYISINWTGTVVLLDDWVRAYNSYPSKTIVIKISDIL